MERTIVHVAQMRMIDVHLGDIVTKDPESAKGWFRVELVKTLMNGDLAIADAREQMSFTGGIHDLVGVQIHSTHQMDIPIDPPMPSDGSEEETDVPAEAEDPVEAAVEAPAPAPAPQPV
ncbi:MAG: hypothetical protein HKN94_05325 [Acidimicrobiales bacterium]|nr:hypothetical protein [Acidimicrobiia bacterium]NNC79555.1 hypothetical protein [Acidimicrobiales bacterium]RZV48607.1 MAG: hypothetical protein EX269_01155 [Acidimicrobiales bacterium]